MELIRRFSVRRRIYFSFLVGLLLLAACTPTEEAPSILVSLVVDGRERTFSYAAPVTVEEFLSDSEVDLGELDRVTPPQFTQITDGMLVTVKRVQEETECERTEVPFSQRTVLNEGLAPGEERLGQRGQNGVEETCYRVRIEDNVPQERIEFNKTVITAPEDEIIYVGPTGELEPVPINGTIAYISNGNAWAIQNSSTRKRPLTTSGDLDQRVFSLSENGRHLLFSRELPAVEESDTRLNQLWLISDVGAEAQPVRLVPESVLFAEWVPGTNNTISYSTAERRTTAAGWQAFNDFWTMGIDPETGDAIRVREVIERSSGGLYGWWGTTYEWSPDGEQLAWVQADAMGVVDLQSGELSRLIEYPVYRTFGDWSWRATTSWSPEGDLLLTQVHGAPVGLEAPETSPAFDIAVTDAEGSFRSTIIEHSGIWSAPQFSPMVTSPDRQFPQGFLAYLRARDPFNSISGEYDLVVADRDGSNSRTIFPSAEQPGLNPQEFTWSPDGRQLAFIYQGNLWVIDVESVVAHQLTLDGGASKPVWRP